MMYFLTAIGLKPGGSSTVHIYTQTNTQNNTINLGRVLAVPRLCELCPGICLTTEENARKNLSQGRSQNNMNFYYSKFKRPAR